MSKMSWTDMMSADQAERIAKLDSSDIATILTISALSQKADDIARIAREIADGGAPQIPIDALTTGPKPLQIVAYSFVRDKKQYGDTYGQSDERANELAALLRTNPDAACEQIKGIVSAKVDARGSGRKVEVLLTGVPASRPPQGSTTTPEGDGGAKELSSEVSKNAAVYGTYQFEPESTGLAGQYQFGVHLGDDLFAIGQSKKVVIAAARICRIKGRFDEMVKPHIWYWTSWASPVRGDEIDDSVWDGKQRAYERIKPRKKLEAELPRDRKRSFGHTDMVAEEVD